MPLKNCRTCGDPFPTDTFPPRKGSKDGRQPWCKACFKTKQAVYRQTYLSDPKKRERNNAAQLRFRKEHPEEARQSSHASFLRLKREMIAAYGGSCKCCGEECEEFLTLEHLNRDGASHRKQVGGGSNTYRDLRNKGWPQEGYTVLCMNCNWSTRFGGTCPHQRIENVSNC